MKIPIFAIVSTAALLLGSLAYQQGVISEALAWVIVVIWAISILVLYVEHERRMLEKRSPISTYRGYCKDAK